MIFSYMTYTVGRYNTNPPPLPCTPTPMSATELTSHVPPMAHRYVPLHTLRVEDTGVHGRVYQAAQVAAALGIPAPMLPVYAVLCGCDHVDCDVTALVRARARKRSPGLPARGNMAVAALLHTFTAPVEALQSIARLLPVQEQKRAREQWMGALTGYQGTAPELEGDGVGK